MIYVAMIAILSVCVYFAYFLGRSALNTGVQWIRRTGSWAKKLGVSGVDAEGASLSDFVGLAGFSLSLLAIFISWQSILLQARKNALEQEARDLAAKISDKQQLIDTNLANLKTRRFDEAIQLESPDRDAQLIGSHVDLEWNYSGHSPFVTYVVEISNQDQSNREEFGPAKPRPCVLTRYRACIFVATDPAGQHSQVFPEEIGILAGSYLWRVAPVQRTVTGEDKFDSDRVSDWSQYRLFSLFPAVRDRIINLQKISVGTTYAEDIRFSTLGNAGVAQGHDIDLVRILGEGCLTADYTNRLIIFDPQACRSSIDRYMQSGKYERVSRPGQLEVSVRPFPSIGEGLDALGRKEVDLFIGSLTRARKRQQGPVLFTEGYFPFETKLYVRSELGEKRLDHWGRKNQKLGVINKSSNYWLATLLERESSFLNRLTVVSFDTYPALEAAFDRGEVGGVLLDDVLGEQLRDATAIEGLQETRAWERYHADEDALGFPKEEFSIAVAIDSGDRESDTQQGLGLQLRHYFFPKADDFVSPRSLFSQLQRALKSDDVQGRLLPKLRDRFIDHPDRY